MLKSNNTNKMPGSEVLRINCNFGRGKIVHFFFCTRFKAGLEREERKHLNSLFLTQSLKTMLTKRH